MITNIKIRFLILFSILFLIGCNQNSERSDASQKSTLKTDDSITLNEENILGAWKYFDSYYGKVFIQFEADGTFKKFYNDEGDAIDICDWRLVDGKIFISRSETNATPYCIDILKFKDDSFYIPPTHYDSLSNNINHNNLVTRLKDEAGEPIFHYSKFETGIIINSQKKNSASNNFINEHQNYQYLMETEDKTSSNSQSSTSQSNVCSYCQGTGVCSNCNKTVRKPSLKDCSRNDRDEIRLGYVLCSDCYGYGYMITNVNCNCYIGWCYEKDCYVSGCNDGWVDCSECREGDLLGKCYHCYGTGKN